MPGPLGHVISNPYKNTFPRVAMSPILQKRLREVSRLCGPKPGSNAQTGGS